MLRFDGMARRCDIDCFFKQWTDQRVWLVEYRQRIELSVVENCFDRYLVSIDVRLDEERVRTCWAFL